MKINLGVIFGGETVEHEVSIISALQAIENLNKEKYNIIPIYIGKDKTMYTGNSLLKIDTYKNFDEKRKDIFEISFYKENNKFYIQTTKGLFRKTLNSIDICLPIVHGNGVEDGTLSGFLDTIGIPYASSKVLGSSIGQDKVIMKQVMKESGIPVCDYVWFYDNDYYENKDNILNSIKKLGYPVIVKPASLGSSVGICAVKSEDKIEDALEEAIEYDNKIVVEKKVENLTEVNISVLGDYSNQKVSPIEEVMGEDEILSFTDKYLSGGKGDKSSKGMASTSRIIPARISKELKDDIEKTSKKVFRVLNLSGVCRIDYLIDKKNNKYYVNEPNTIPGSLAFYLWKEADISYTQLLDEIISIGIKEYKNKSKKIRSFESNILSGYNGSKGLKK